MLEIITSDPTQISPVHTPEEKFGLGYRGLIVREIKSDDGIWKRTNRTLENPLPWAFRVGSKPEKQVAAEWLLQIPEKKCSKVTDELREVIEEGVVLVPTSREVVDLTTSRESSKVPQSVRWETCHSNLFYSNASTFNQPQNISHNNCYPFASNHVGGGRWAHPGLHGGYPAREFNCSEVQGGLYADGWTHHGCWPNALKVLIIACFIFPGHDFHFYRIVSEGPRWLWTHKQGDGPARHTDNNGRTIENDITPLNCN
ncbi:hypothetical protein LIT25_22785 [Bacillus sp. F19]|nr:hypothetical protein LIT25_22785 [Bacillus sp. F19]